MYELKLHTFWFLLLPLEQYSITRKLGFVFDENRYDTLFADRSILWYSANTTLRKFAFRCDTSINKQEKETSGVLIFIKHVKSVLWL